MAIITFDTPEYSTALQEAGVPGEQAEALAKANAKLFHDMIGALDLVTKKDLAIALAETKHEILKWMVMGMLTQTALLVAIIAFCAERRPGAPIRMRIFPGLG